MTTRLTSRVASRLLPAAILWIAGFILIAAAPRAQADPLQIFYDDFGC